MGVKKPNFLCLSGVFANEIIFFKITTLRNPDVYGFLLNNALSLFFPVGVAPAVIFQIHW